MYLRRRIRSVLLVAGLAAGIVTAWAAPAAAHAVLLETSPVGGQILLKPPKDIQLKFDQPVEASLGAVRLYDTSGRRIDTGATTKPSSEVVQVPIRTKLASGAYVVTWRVISADSHPVQGSFTFQVGTSANATAPQVQALAGSLLSKEGGSKVVGAIYGVARWAVFLALALFLGAGAFLLFVWPRGVWSRRARALVRAGWVGLFVATLASLLLEGPYGAGLGLSAAWRSSVIGDVLDTHFGHVMVVRLMLLVLMAPMLGLWFHHRDAALRASAWWRFMAVVLAAGVLLTVSLAGHADVGSFVPFALAADWIHLASMSVWVGGLIVLAVAVLAPRDLDEQRAVVPRFSQVALVCVVALIASGAYQTWRQVGGLEAFKRTDYGQLLVIKLAIFVLLLVIATRSRSITNYVFRREVLEPTAIPVVAGAADDSTPWVHRPSAPDSPFEEALDDEEDDEIDEEFERRSLRRAVAFEALLAVVILAVSALLVNAQPGRSALKTLDFAQGSSNVTLKSEKIWVDITVAPGVKGPNDVHVNTLVASGGITTPLDLKITFDLPSKGIAPLDVPLVRAGSGHYLSTSFVIPLAGQWRVTARALLTPVDEAVVVGTITIR
jgi:copper transport protein